jgi:tetratricopeptide (TPR) repeat protein
MKNESKKTDGSAPQEGDKTAGFLEKNPVDQRARMRRGAVTLLVIMVTLLMAVLYFEFSRDPARGRKDFEDLLVAPPARTSFYASGNSTPGGFRAASSAEMERTVNVGEPPAGLDPAKVSAAMAELKKGSEFLGRSEWDQAEEHALRALEIAPQMGPALRMLGMIHLQRNQYDQAVQVLEQALKAEPYNGEVYNTLAAAYLNLKQNDKAAQLLRTAIEIRPRYALAHLNLGLLYLLEGDNPSAIEHLEQARIGLPSNVSVLNNLAVAYIRTAQFEKAREPLTLLVNANGRLPATYYNMALSYALEGRMSEALGWLSQAREKFGDTVTAEYIKEKDFEPLRKYDEFVKFEKSLQSKDLSFPEEP